MLELFPGFWNEPSRPLSLQFEGSLHQKMVIKGFEAAQICDINYKNCYMEQFLV